MKNLLLLLLIPFISCTKEICKECNYSTYQDGQKISESEYVEYCGYDEWSIYEDKNEYYYEDSIEYQKKYYCREK